MTAYTRKTRCALARCPYCSWFETFFGVDALALKLRVALEQVFHSMTAHKGSRGGVR